MGFFSNPIKAIKSSLGGVGGSALGTMILPGIGTIAGGALGQAAQNSFRGKSPLLGAIKGGTFGAGLPLTSSIIPNDRKKRALAHPSQELITQQFFPPQKSNQFLSNQQLAEKLRNRLTADSLALNNSNYPTYKGEMVAPESALTQRARTLRQEDINKAVPYSKKVGTMLNKEATGFSPEQTRALLDIIGRGGNDQNEVLNRLQKQFGRNYGYENERGTRLQSKIDKDVERADENTLSNFKRLNEEFKDVENRRNMDVAKTFHDAGLQKSARRGALINQLEDFGNQDYNLRNLQNMAKRDSFDEETQIPGRKIAIASKALNNLGSEEDHPSLTAARNKELQRIQNAYNAPHSNYPGQRVIGIQPESQEAMDRALSLSPKHRDSFYADRKNIERNALNNSLPNQAFNAIPEAVDPLMKNLDYLTKQQLKKQSKEIAGKHVRLGSYGSGTHKAETEKSLREILNRIRQEREGALTNVTKGETSLATRREQTGLTKHRLLDMLGSQEFNNILDKNNQLNNIGFNRRSHKQAEENAALREWYAQLQHSMEGSNPNGYSNLAKQYSTDLPSLFNRPQAYNNNLQAFNQYKNTTRQGLTDPTSRRQLEEWEEQQKRSLMGNGYSPQYGSYDNLRSQALALARATPVY